MARQRLSRRLRAGALVSAAGLGVVLVPDPATVGAATTRATVAPRAVASAPPLRPNLMVLPASDIHIQRTGSVRRLRFESGIGNIGQGPVEVRPNRNRPCPDGKHHATQVMYRDVDGNSRFRRDVDTRLARRSAGCMVFHPAHDHWHFEAASRYTLLRRDEPENARVARRKMSFCLRDSERVPERFGTPGHPLYYGACSRYSPQGISVGWVDVYQSFLAGQALRLPASMGDGVYCLHIRVDPRGMLEESLEDDNTSVRTLAIRGDRVNVWEWNKRCRKLTG